jgi:ribonuclease Z
LRFSVTILGSGSAIPTLRRNPSAQYINIQERHFLMDCAEGTQLQMRRYEVPLQQLNAVFISHLHGDHYLGLMGLLSTMHLLGRRLPLQLYGPPELKEVIDFQLHVGRTTLGFPLNFIPLIKDETQDLYSDKMVEVKSFPLKHRIPCWGFRFNEKPFKRKIIKEKVIRHKIPVAWMKRLIDGEDYISEDGKLIANKALTEDPKRSRSYAYCSDTAYDESIIPNIRAVDLLYHEATFAEVLIKRAHQTFHSTAKEAASIALQAGATKLVVGHYSARYRNPDEIVNEARQVFSNTVAAEDGLIFNL